MAERSEIESVAAIVDSLDTESSQFAEVAKVVARKTAGLRHATGRVSPELHQAYVEMAGASPCIEVIVRGKEGELYLKRRESEENANPEEERAWGGRLHFPGTTFFSSQSLVENLIKLLRREVVGGEEERRDLILWGLLRTLKPAGVYAHDEQARRTIGFKTLVEVTIDGPGILLDGYERVTKENLYEVIDDHQPLARRILDGRGLLIFDTRRKS